MEKKPIISVTRDDCEWEYMRGSGKGGQKKNKTSSAVRCTHVPSGAVGRAEDHREQSRNRQLAFVRMTECARFNAWLKLETYKILGIEDQLQQTVNKEMKKIKIEGQVDGKWVELDKEDI